MSKPRLHAPCPQPFIHATIIANLDLPTAKRSGSINLIHRSNALDDSVDNQERQKGADHRDNQAEESCG